MKSLVVVLAATLGTFAMAALGAQAFILWDTDPTYAYIYLVAVAFSIATLYFPIRSMLDLKRMREKFECSREKVLIVHPPEALGAVDNGWWLTDAKTILFQETEWTPGSYAQAQSRLRQREWFLVQIETPEQAHIEAGRMSHALHQWYPQLMREGYRVYSVRDRRDQSILTFSVTPGNRMTHAVGYQNRLPTDEELEQLKVLVEAHGITFDYDPNTKY